MNKMLSVIAVFSILSLGFVASSQAKSMTQRGFTTYETTHLVGLTVKSRDGVQLGRIFDLVLDSNGHIDFAIVTQQAIEEYWGRLVVVPFSMLTISKAQSGKTSAVFNANKEKFYEGPDWSYENLANPKQAASVYKYYGVQPYWTRARQSELEKFSGMGNPVYGAKRDAFAFASLLGAAYTASNSFGTDSTGKSGFITFDMYGVPLKNAHGEFLGSISDIVLDKGDLHAFALINIGSRGEYGESGGLTPVPMVALKISQMKSGRLNIVLNDTEANLEDAPHFDATKIDNPQYEAEIYRYYGIQPYWTEKSVIYGK